MTTRPTAATQRLVRARARDCCERCGGSAEGGSYHHRRAKGMGGDRRPETQLAANILLLCGSGTTGCHGWVHAHAEVARAAGWIVSRYGEPTTQPVELALHGWRLLTDDGSHAPALSA